MRLIYIATLSLAVAACVSTPPIEQRWLAACETRAATLRSLNALRQAGALSADATEDVISLVVATTGICSGDTPPETPEAVAQLESNILKLINIRGNADVEPRT